MMQGSLARKLRVLRAERGWPLRIASLEIGVTKETLSDLERGLRRPHDVTLSRIARGYGVPVEDLLLEEPVLAGPKATAPDSGPPQASQEELTDDVVQGEQPTREPLSPSERRFAAQARRAELDRVLKHLTLRLEALRDQAKTHYEAGAAPEELWPLFMESMLLGRGAEAVLIDNREEAAELGGETEEERHLRERLEHRAEDAGETSEKIGDMFLELLGAETDAENEAELPDRGEVLHFLRKQAG